MSTLTRVQPFTRRDYAERTLRKCGNKYTWPPRQEAHVILGELRSTAIQALLEYDLLCADLMTWREYDPDLWVHDDPQEEAITVAIAKALDCVTALHRRLAEYRRQDKKAASVSSEGETRCH